MLITATQRWTMVLILLVTATPIDLQVPMPVPIGLPAPPPMPVAVPMPVGVPQPYPMPVGIPHPVPMPVPVPIPFAVHIRRMTTTTTTTTTTQKPTTKNPYDYDDGGGDGTGIGIIIPYPIPPAFPPMPPPAYCMMAPMAPKCPVCPPCVCMPCIPSFFSYCSPCHQRCRCKNGQAVPQPMPLPAGPMGFPMQPSVMVVPFPQSQRERRPGKHKSSTSSDDSSSSGSSSSSSSSSERRHRRRYFYPKRRLPFHRRSNHKSIAKRKDKQLVKPMLSYMTKDGKVKYQTKLSDADAKHLLDSNPVRDQAPKSNGHSVARLGGSNHNRIILTNEPSADPSSSESKTHETKELKKEKKYLLMPNKNDHVLESGKKELIFRPPKDKRISNISLSFHVD